MGRLWNRIKQGVRKVGRFIGRVAEGVGRVAGGLSNVPVIGNIASTVARGANLVSKIGNGAANLIDRGERIRQKYQPVIDKVRDAGRAIRDSGVADKVTGGRFSRFADRVRNIGHRVMDRVERQGGRFANAIHNARIIGGKGDYPKRVQGAPAPAAPT